ncbi:MAG: hypothetical protein WD844_13070 [Thermoleophilaceae bacterium]
MRALARAAVTAAACFGLGVLASAGQGTQALFSSASSNPGNAFSAAPDLTAPSAAPAVVGKASGGSTGYIKQGGSYHVYANVTDGGSPPSGTASVSADVSGFDSGQTSVPMSSGSWTAGGQSFNYRSAALTANDPQPGGSHAFSFALADVVGNARTQTGFSVMVDNTKPSGTDIQTQDGNGDSGQPGSGDRVIFSFSEPIERESILAGWTGGTATVTVRIKDGGVLLGLLGDDELEIRNAGNSATLPFGTIDLNAGGYVTGLLGGYGVWSSSTMTMSANQVTVTLGTHSGLGTGEGGCCPEMQWAVQSAFRDRADNNANTGTVTESGNDEDF